MPRRQNWTPELANHAARQREKKRRIREKRIKKDKRKRKFKDQND